MTSFFYQENYEVRIKIQDKLLRGKSIIQILVLVHVPIVPQSFKEIG